MTLYDVLDNLRELQLINIPWILYYKAHTPIKNFPRIEVLYMRSKIFVWYTACILYYTSMLEQCLHRRILSKVYLHQKTKMKPLCKARYALACNSIKAVIFRHSVISYLIYIYLWPVNVHGHVYLYNTLVDAIN